MSKITKARTSISEGIRTVSARRDAFNQELPKYLPESSNPGMYSDDGKKAKLTELQAGIRSRHASQLRSEVSAIVNRVETTIADLRTQHRAAFSARDNDLDAGKVALFQQEYTHRFRSNRDDDDRVREIQQALAAAGTDVNRVKAIQLAGMETISKTKSPMFLERAWDALLPEEVRTLDEDIEAATTDLAVLKSSALRVESDITDGEFEHGRAARDWQRRPSPVADVFGDTMPPKLWNEERISLERELGEQRGYDPSRLLSNAQRKLGSRDEVWLAERYNGELVEVPAPSA